MIDRRTFISLAVGGVSAVLTGACGQADATGSTDPGLAPKLEPSVTKTMKELAIPGAVVVVRSPRGEYRKAFGTRTIGQHDPVDDGDYFRIGSNTKTMTGTVILQLVQEHRIALTDPVSAYRPDVPNGDRISIAELLEMRSGLDTYSNLVSVNRTLDEDPTKVWQPEELVRLGLSLPPKYPPGQEFFYSNTNLVILGLIIEKLTHQKLEDTFADRIFGPLRLSHTMMPPRTSGAIPTPHPHGYLFGTNVSTLDNPAMPSPQQAAALAGTLLPHDVTNLNPSWAWAAGAAISTAPDLATYVEALIGGGLLDPALQQQRLNSVRPTSPGNQHSAGYGLALAGFGAYLGHDGSLPGYQSFMGHDPTTATTLVVLTNLQNAPDGQATANAIAKTIMPFL